MRGYFFYSSEMVKAFGGSIAAEELIGATLGAEALTG
jgi:hypothetical protein